MSLENALIPTQQAKAVIDLILADHNKYLKDETAVHALYSVMDNLNRVLNGLDELLDETNAIYQALCQRGILREVMDEIHREKGAEVKS